MRHAKVLLVDDEVEFGTTLAERLRLRKYDATCAFFPEDAFRGLRDSPPDVVLLDMKMPGMDGKDVLREIKRIDPTIEVIILTGVGMTQDIEPLLENGAFDCILKPIDIEVLTMKINEAQQKRERS
ncbi:MAG: response regulator [Nitrospirota bacterium]